jgi:hypothetical protein
MTSTGPRQSALPGNDPDPADSATDRPPCVLVFNASDPSGAGGLAADIGAIASVGAHALPIVTGAYTRDTAEILDHHAFDEEAVSEQARTVLEDVTVQVIKVGFVGSIENISAIAEIAADYADVPVIAYMPDLSWWSEVQIDLYLDAFRDLMLPQTTVLVGNHSTLCRWLLPDWKAAKAPGPRDIARAAEHAFGVRPTRWSPASRCPTTVHRKRAGHPAVGALQRALRAPGGRLLRRRRHPVGALAALLATERPGEAVQRSPGLPGPLPGSRLPPRHGPSWCPTACSGPSPRPDEESEDNADDSSDPRIDFPDHDTKH